MMSLLLTALGVLLVLAGGCAGLLSFLAMVPWGGRAEPAAAILCGLASAIFLVTGFAVLIAN
jgi:hypothetical protein